MVAPDRDPDGGGEAALAHALVQVERTPADPRAWRDLARCFLQSGRPAGSVEASKQALRLDSQSGPAWTTFGLALRRTHQHLAGRRALEKAVSFSPHDAACWGNLASAQEALGEVEAAINAARKAVEKAPDEAGWHAVLGTALRSAGRIPEALLAYTQAKRLSPDDPRIPWNRALALLSAHDFAAGFEAYECRRKRVEHRPLPTPEWTQGPAPSGGLLVHCEQGFGDTLQWARFVPRLSAQTRRVVVAAPRRLHAMLLRVGGVDAVITKEDARKPDALRCHDCAAHVGLMSLGALLGERGPTLADDLPLWSPSASEVAPYALRTGLRIGIGWQGNPAYERDHLRSPPLSAFTRVVDNATARGVSVVSFQKVHGLGQLIDATGPLRKVLDLGAILDTGPEAFIDTAAVMSATDLVLTSDTATAHLAGSLPVETWLLLSRPADWRWGHLPESTPWYPRMRVFRQPTPGDWTGLFHNVDRALSSWIGDRQPESLES